jgi:hypothetical protein
MIEESAQQCFTPLSHVRSAPPYTLKSKQKKRLKGQELRIALLTTYITFFSPHLLLIDLHLKVFGGNPRLFVVPYE